jgi:digeranylgeranylglycerophospholipid reductase
VTPIRYDVAVVGAGPAGSMAALEAARAGASVILLERRREVGVPVQCAEYVPWQLAEQVPWSTDCVVQAISAMQTFLPDGEVVESPHHGFMIHRWAFDQHLARCAVEAGAALWLQTRVAERTTRGLLARRAEEHVEIEAAIIVGADGPRSTVGGWIGAVNTELVAAAQYTVTLERPLTATQIYFDPEYVGGYGWLFPKGKLANVGVAVQAGLSLSERLAHFLDRLSIDRGAIVRRTGGLVPSGGPLGCTWQDNIILVGDAAGQAHPITGAGVAHACLCGQLAGRAAARAALHHDLGLLAEYESDWRDYVGGALRHAADKRHFLDASWSDDRRSLSAALRETWVAFPGYGKRVPRPA